MRPYGLTRRDCLRCHYGCCRVMDRAIKTTPFRRRARKHARRVGKQLARAVG